MGRCLGGLATALVFLPALAVQDLPHPCQFERVKVVAVRRVSRAIPLKTGAPFRVADLRESIKKLYATGRYSDVRATGAAVEGGVAITFRTEQQWFIGRIAASGQLYENPTRGQAAEASRLNLGQPVSDEELGQATGRILDLLKCMKRASGRRWTAIPRTRC